MAKYPALPMWTDAFIGDTTHLSNTQVGIYILLLFAAWRSPNCDLPDDDIHLANIARCPLQIWRRYHREAMAKLHEISGGRWVQKRLRRERDYVERLSKKMSDNARLRWNKNKDIADADAMQLECNWNAPIPREQKMMPSASSSSALSRARRAPAPQGVAVSRAKAGSIALPEELRRIERELPPPTPNPENEDVQS